ncbi:hypothetical protein [Chryseobacterium binzhouense]|uniref:hypothetical protein n=1 Tax=Chryseobacterium binzhouense TaxID=2593646 RepID=UPI001180D682|nr:hypothetical protein [Chryseobacterium binzhouense]
MRNVNIIACFFLFGFTFAQNDKVGIGTETPSAMLDIVTKGNNDAAKALEINNSSNTELLKVTNDGKVGINIGANIPDALLHINSQGIKNIRHQNLPVLNETDYTPPFNNLGVSSNGNAVGIPTTVKYLYYQNGSAFPATYNNTNNTGGFSLSNTNQYINLPIRNDAGLKGDTIGMTFGTDTNATINGQSVSNVQYITIPEPGVYLFEFYGTARCNRFNDTQNYTFNGQIEVNTIFASASGTIYTTDTIFRGRLDGMRNDSGSTFNTSYSLANPQTLTVAYQTTQANQKVALFFNYAGGDNDFSKDECLFNIPAGSNFSYYFIITRL